MIRGAGRPGVRRRGVDGRGDVVGPRCGAHKPRMVPSTRCAASFSIWGPGGHDHRRRLARRHHEVGGARPDLPVGVDRAIVQQRQEHVQVLPHVAHGPFEGHVVLGQDAGLVGEADAESDAVAEAFWAVRSGRRARRASGPTWG